MPIRNRHVVGEHLVVDDESGIVGYASEMRTRWDGAMVREKGWETKHPQYFVRAKRDPYPLKNVRPAAVVDEPTNVISTFIGETSVRTPLTGPAAHLFTSVSNPPPVGGSGVGFWLVGVNFVVS